MALGGVQDHQLRLCRGCLQRRPDRIEIMPIHAVDRDRKAPKFVGEWIHRGHGIRRPETLQRVVIAQNGQVCQLVMAEENQSFPSRSLLPLAVGE